MVAPLRRGHPVPCGDRCSCTVHDARAAPTGDRDMRTTMVMRVALAAVVVGLTTSCDAQDPMSAASLALSRSERGNSGPAAEKPTIVLVHGAWADATGWQDLIPLLQKEGYKVVASQNPLTSFADDAATTRRLIEGQTGPVVVVGHSYGGAIM